MDLEFDERGVFRSQVDSAGVLDRELAWNRKDQNANGFTMRLNCAVITLTKKECIG